MNMQVNIASKKTCHFSSIEKRKSQSRAWIYIA